MGNRRAESNSKRKVCKGVLVYIVLPYVCVIKAAADKDHKAISRIAALFNEVLPLLVNLEQKQVELYHITGDVELNFGLCEISEQSDA